MLQMNTGMCVVALVLNQLVKIQTVVELEPRLHVHKFVKLDVNVWLVLFARVLTVSKLPIVKLIVRQTKSF